MPTQERIRVLGLVGERGEQTEPLWAYLRSTRTIDLEAGAGLSLPDRLDEYQALVLADPARLSAGDQERLAGFVRRGGGCLALVGAEAELPPVFGARVGPAGPPAELELRFADPAGVLARRLPAERYLRDRLLPLEPISGATQPLLTAGWHTRRIPVALLRSEGAGAAGCLSLQSYGEPFVQQLAYRMLRQLAGMDEPAPLGLAVIGYGPIAQLHGAAAQAVPGLELRAICDLSPQRLAQAQADFPGLRTYQAVDELLRDQDVDVVVVATPPNTHAELSIRLLRAGKHVVCEKPLCFTQAEAAAMIETAARHDRLLSCHQNRRWDVDFLAVRQAIGEGLVGEPFHLELFVGDYSHPCQYWHSHQPVSGGTLYDWGAHYLDWALQLFPGPTASVVGIEHKRVWHDVTNADQARAQVRFAGGQEAEFLYSDIAALRKPKWYLLGTEGAIVGHWNEITVRAADPLYFLREEPIPTTETPPHLTLRRRHASGRMVEQPLALPERERHPFHLSLANHLLTGEPLAVTAESSARVVAVLEAAGRSARHGGSAEELRV
ncbi:MAG: Gfo/Idh/MocA family oxidoreductase [Kouleothrix sp.]|nr:Gfo/Idh/MocA family oxidoreductase [Kouleothrix sp.]